MGCAKYVALSYQIDIGYHVSIAYINPYASYYLLVFLLKNQ